MYLSTSGFATSFNNSYIFVSQKEKKNLIIVSPMGSNIQFSDPEYMGREITPGGDLLDDPLTPCAGALRTIAFTI